MIHVTITAEDILDGVHNAPNNNPVALAMSRALGCVIFVFKSSFQPLYLWELDKDYRSFLPAAAREFIKALDEGTPVKPFEFDIEDPRPTWDVQRRKT